MRNRLRNLVVGVAALLACGEGGQRLYDNNDLELATSYTAKEACSCIFVMEQDEDFCRNWTKASPNVAEFTVNRDSGTVKSAALLFWGARARFVDAKTGCILE